MIKGLGVDLVKIGRIEDMYQRWGERFLHKIFTGEELAYCQRKAEVYQHLAGRFAAKEAVLKMLGTGFRGLSWKDIEIKNNELGRPEITLYRKAREYAKNADIRNVHLSISHEKDYAFAEVIGEG